MDDLSGTRLGHFTINQQIGRGGMSKVYLATDDLLTRQVAIKVLEPGSEETSSFLYRFKREAETLARLHHTNIVSIYERGEQDNLAYLVMPYCKGGSLREKLRGQAAGRPAFSPQGVLGIVEPVLYALDYAHNEGIIHRDIKPSNILFDTHGIPLLSDFGLVKRQTTKDQTHSPVDTQTNPQTDQLLGTPAYAAPENIQTVQSDIYSIGVMLYEMLTGKRPFEAETNFALYYQHLHKEPQNLHEVNEQISSELSDVVLKALHKDPQKRYQSVRALVVDLKNAITAMPQQEITRPIFPSDYTSQEHLTYPVTRPAPTQPFIATEPGISRQVTRSGLETPSFTTPPTLRLPTRRKSYIAAIIASIILLLAGITGGEYYFLNRNTSHLIIPTPAVLLPTSKIIKISTDLPVGGYEASNGKPVENGAQMAVDVANNTHMLPSYALVLVPKDDTGAGNVHDPQKGIQNIQDAIADAQVAGNIGPFNSDIAVDTMPIANQAPLAQISPATTNSCLTKNTPETDCTGSNNLQTQVRPTGKVTYFRLATYDSYQGKAVADYFHNEKHYKSIYMIEDQQNLYSSGFAQEIIKEWTKIGGTQVAPAASVPNNSSQDTYQKLIQDLSDADLHPDLIYFSGNNRDGKFVRQAMENVPSFKNTPFAGGGGIVDSDFAQAMTPVTGGPIYGTVPIEDPSQAPNGRSFQTDYQGAGVNFNNYRPYTASAYDSTMILIKAIGSAINQGAVPPGNAKDATAAKKFRQQVIDQIHKSKYDGVTGHHEFDADGDTTNTTISLYQLTTQNGETGWHFLKLILTPA